MLDARSRDDIPGVLKGIQLASLLRTVCQLSYRPCVHSRCRSRCTTW